MKKVVFITGTRADFGYIKSLISILYSRPDLYEVFIFATGTHFSSKHGYTINDIYEDRYKNIYAYMNHKEKDTMDIMLSNTIYGFSNYKIIPFMFSRWYYEFLNNNYNNGI